jgi:hypothetical protein
VSLRDRYLNHDGRYDADDVGEILDRIEAEHAEALAAAVAQARGDALTAVDATVKTARESAREADAMRMLGKFLTAAPCRAQSEYNRMQLLALPDGRFSAIADGVEVSREGLGASLSDAIEDAMTRAGK